MDKKKTDDLQRTYDTVADEYTRRISDELEHKPLDRQLLDRFAGELRGAGLVCDLGCGPGHVARYLHDRGVEVLGVDLSRGMVEQARALTPEIPFRQGDMLALDVEDGAWAGIAAFYSIIHIPRDEAVAALREMRRALRPQGLLLVAFHVGDDVLHLDEWWERPVSADFTFFQVDEMERYLTTAGFALEETVERPPYEGVEHPSQRAYLFARNPG